MLHFDLDNSSLKARFIPPEYPDMLFLLDTGADVPVWCKGYIYLSLPEFSQSVHTNKNYIQVCLLQTSSDSGLLLVRRIKNRQTVLAF